MNNTPRPFSAETFRKAAADSAVATSPAPAPTATQRIDQPAPQMEVRHLVKTYRRGTVDIPVLADVSMHVRQGELLAIVGQSGSGKSTLLHLMGTLDGPTGGEIHYAGRRIDNLPVRQRDRLRNEQFGMIFQSYHLQPELNTLENVLMPLMIRHGVLSYMAQRGAFRRQAMQLLEKVGLAHRIHHRPRELSGGEMQRTAIARALVGNPSLLLADEPTGNLDQKTGQEILAILRTLNRQENLSIVMVTHDMSIAAQADRIVRLVAGQVESV
jgi:lipoprotein-releasing system ATP-binding protein